MSPTKRASKGGVEQEAKVKKSKDEVAVTVEDVPMEESKKVIDPQDLYAIEDKIASELGTTVMTERMKESTNVLREILEKFIGGETQSIDMRSATLSTIQLRRYSRLIYYANATKKKEVTQKMESVESKYMQLQNQSSEVGHLQKEIERCLLYPSNDEEISLVPLEEFYEKAKPEISRPDVTRSDEHEQKVARLIYEREERKHLVNTLNELEFRRSVLTSDINMKESRIKSLKPKMDGIIKSSRSMEEGLGMKVSSSDRPSFPSLPPPLNLLNIQAEAYKKLIDDSLANKLKEKKEDDGDENIDMDGIEESGKEGDEDSQEDSSEREAVKKEEKMDDLFSMGGVESKVNNNAIQKEIIENPVMVYSKKSCGFCTKAKSLLKEENIAYTESDLDDVRRLKPEEYNSYINGLVYTSRVTSVPQIFICGKFIGGYTELEKLVEGKKLLEMIDECTGENARKWN